MLRRWVFPRSAKDLISVFVHLVRRLLIEPWLHLLIGVSLVESAPDALGSAVGSYVHQPCSDGEVLGPSVHVPNV